MKREPLLRIPEKVEFDMLVLFPPALPLYMGREFAREKYKNWRSLILQVFTYNLIRWKLAELLCVNSCVTISVQMTLQAGVL